MKLKHIAAAAVLAVSGSAFAVGPGSLGAIDNLPTIIGNTVTPGIFQDLYTFSIVNPGAMGGSVTASNFFTYNILGLAVSLVDSSLTQVGFDNTPANFTFSGLSAGSYALNVIGFASGSSGGVYGGSFVVQTAPVPEPETYALMLAGLGIVGFMASRRKQS